LLAKEKRPEAVSPPTPAPQPAPEPTVSAPVSPAARPVVPQVSSPSKAEPGSRLRTAGLLTAAVGGVAVVAGIVFNVKANSLASDMGKVDGYTSGKESDWSTYKTLTWVGYGAGAACIAGGAILYVLGLRSDSPAASVALAPTVGPSQAGMVLKGEF
jgi:hypothetical protein